MIIPAYNEQDRIAACLNALSIQSRAPLEIIVVDNNSDDKTAEIAARYALVKLVKESKQGIAYARNAGFDAARGDVIARIDADTIVSADWLARLSRHFERPDVIGVSGAPYLYDHPLPSLASKVYIQYLTRGTKLISGSYLLWGSNMAILRQTWLRVRSSVNNSPKIWEDVDLSTRAAKLGLIVFDADLVVGASARSALTGMVGLADYFSRWPRTYAQFSFRMYFVSYLLFVTLTPFWIPTAIIGLMPDAQSKIRRVFIRLSGIPQEKQ